MKEEEFYIGYYPNAPKGISQTIKIVVAAVLVIILVSAFVITRSEKGFSNSQFEYGTLTTLEGVLYRQPVPMLRVHTGIDVNGNNLYKSVLLVNFNKFGAENLLMEYTRKGVSEGESLVKLRGTLIYYDGVTVMELTDQENALLSHSNAICSKDSSPKTLTFELDKAPKMYDIRKKTLIGEATLNGEIVDPKCYFGSMKPGQSTPHRDCAIRCISGGIPPVFALKNPSGEMNYLLITGQKGEAINQQLLKYVGIPTQLKGTIEKIDEWYLLRVEI